MRRGKKVDGKWLERLTGPMGRLVASQPGKIALVFAVLTVISLVPIQGMDTSTSMADFSPNSEFIYADGVLREEFDTTRPLVAVMESDDGLIIDREGLLALRSMEEAIASSPRLAPYLADDVIPVLTIAVPVEAILRGISNGSWGIESAPDEALASALDQAMRDPGTGYLVSQAHPGRYALVVVNLDHSSLERDDESIEIELQEVMDGAAQEGYTVHSFFAFSERMKEDTLDDLGLIMPLVLILILVVLWLSLRSVVDVVISLAGVVSILIISFGVFALAGLRFSQMTFFGPILILVLAIDFSIHLLYRFNENRRLGDQHGPAMTSSIRTIGIAILASTVTTVVAFMSNGLSSIPAVVGFGLFVGIGIAISFVVMMLLVPSLKLLAIRWGGARGARVPKRSSRTLGLGFLKAVRSYPWVVIGVSFALFAGSLLAAGNIPTDMSARDALADDSDVIRAIDIVETEFPVTNSRLTYVVVLGDVTDPEVLAHIDRSMANMADDRWVVVADGIPRVTSVLPMIRIASSSTTGGAGTADVGGSGLPGTREAVTAVLDKLWEEGIPGAVSQGEVRALLSRDVTGTSYDGMVLAIETRSSNVEETGKLLGELRDDMRPLEQDTDCQVLYAGGELEGYQMVVGMVDGMMSSTLVTVVICTIIVIVLLRSVPEGLITAAPIMLISGWILGAMYLLDFNLNMVTATVTAITVGVGIDYSIHFMERYREERSRGRDLAAALDTTASTTGVSLMAASATTLIGFAMISLSKITMFRTFGVLSALMIVLSLTSVMLVLPSLLTIAERHRSLFKNTSSMDRNVTPEVDQMASD